MASIDDVARAAGVSISTVSYVMSGKRAISPPTRERVLRAIRDLDYHPHAAARSLASRESNVIGLQAPLRAGVEVHVVMQVVTGVVTQARERGYDVLLLASDEPEALERAARGKMVDALILLDVESNDERISTLVGIDQPSVLVGLPTGVRKIPCVDFDFEAAAWLAVSRLVERGHRDLVLIGAPEEVVQRHTSYVDRLNRGFLAACEAEAVTGSIYSAARDESAGDTIERVIAEHPAATGVFIHNEGALPHLAQRLVERRDSGRWEYEAVALCPDALGRSVPGLLDYIAIPAEQMGMTAVETLFAALQGEQAPGVLLLPPVLASQRPSTGTGSDEGQR